MIEFNCLNENALNEMFFMTSRLFRPFREALSGEKER